MFRRPRTWALLGLSVFVGGIALLITAQLVAEASCPKINPELPLDCGAAWTPTALAVLWTGAVVFAAGMVLLFVAYLKYRYRNDQELTERLTQS